MRPLTLDDIQLPVDNITSNSAIGRGANLELFAPLDPLESLALLSSQDETQDSQSGESTFAGAALDVGCWRWPVVGESAEEYECESISVILLILSSQSSVDTSVIGHGSEANEVHSLSVTDSCESHSFLAAYCDLKQ